MNRDNEIPISCGECIGAILVGYEAMIEHILVKHPNYSIADAKEYATAWLESAYEEEAVRDAEHAAHMKGRRHATFDY